MKYLIFLFFTGISRISAAQLNVGVSVNVNVNLPNVALIDIKPSNSAIVLALQSPSTAGQPVTVPSTNSSKWLNFTSAIPTGLSRRIVAQITSGSVPAGLSLKLNLSNYAGTSGGGTLGSPAGSLSLGGSVQNIISGIGAAFTGNGTNNGYNLVYGLEISNYSLLRRDNTAALIITYTMADN